MRFQNAVLATEGLKRAYRPGLQALKRADRARILCRRPQELAGSVDLDSVLQHAYPSDPVWDYGVAHRARHDAEVVYWVEVHPASSSHIQEVLDKLSWLKQWLVSSAPSLNALKRQFVWVASGSVHLPPNTPERRRLASSGIRFAGKVLSL
jgi:hypothetical protein